MITQADEPDIIVNMGKNEYIVTSAVVDPMTKGNIDTYVVKDNARISFSITNHDIDSKNVIVKNYYYRTFKGKNIKIRLKDMAFTGGVPIEIVPDFTYNVLEATNRLTNSLFIFEFDYKYKGESKVTKFAFKFGTDKEYEMYKDMVVNKEEDEETIKRPKANK